jgi:hypothetical protein
MLRCHFKGAHWSNLTIIFDGEDNILKSIELNQFFWWNLNLFLLTDITIELLLVSILIICGIISWCLSLSLFALNLLELPLWLTGEIALISINMCLVLVVEIWHLLEQEIAAQSPVELLHWEFEAVLVSNGYSHVVIVFDAYKSKLQKKCVPVNLPQKRSSSQFISVCSLWRAISSCIL